MDTDAAGLGLQHQHGAEQRLPQAHATRISSVQQHNADARLPAPASVWKNETREQMMF
jgi:hypothetical protein